MVLSGSLEEGEIIDLTWIERDDHHAGNSVSLPFTPHCRFDKFPSPSLNNHSFFSIPLDIATKNRKFNTVTRPNLAARAPVNQRRRRAHAPSTRPGRQRRRSRSRSWSRSRSRSPIAARDTQRDEESKLDAFRAINVSKTSQQTEGRESEKQDQQEEKILTPTEKRIKQTAEEEAEKQQNVEKTSQQSSSGHNAVVDNLLRYGTGYIK
jgi:hypothetical protein